MNSARIKGLLIVLSVFTVSQVRSQNIGVNASGATPNLSAMLDVDVAALVTKKGLLIPRMTSAEKTAMNPLPAAAQGLVVYQTDGIEGFYYNISTTAVPNWMYISPSTSGWSITGNSGTTASASAIGTAANNNFIGTTDAKDFVFISSNLERMRIASAGNIGIGTLAPTATALVTINPTVNALRNGIDMTMTNATSTATGLNITTANSNVNGILVTQSSGALATSMYNIGAVLSTTNIVSGYNAYRNGSGLSYGLYSINGTNAAYTTNANTWAAFLQGRTVISSESSPTSLLGTDLEVRNTTTGAAAPATVSMRQTNSLTTNGNILTNLNFGDNHQTGAEAQIQVIRGAAGGVGDLPTDMLFYTTPDASAVLTERMRIANTGYVGIGTTPITSLDVNGAYSARFSTAVAAAAVVIPNNISLFRLSVLAAVQANALSVATPQDGQFLTIINEDGDPATFAGYTIPAISGATAGVGSFVYSATGAVWRQVASAPAAGAANDWALTGNSGTTPSASAIGTAIVAGQNYIGTSDAKDFVIGTTNLERMRVLSGGNIGIANKVPAYLFEIGNNLFDVNSTGNVGIGTAPSSPIIHINGSFTSTFGGAGASWGISYSAISNNTFSSTHWGASFSGVANVGSAVNNLTGVQGEASVDDVTLATMNSAVGVYGVVDNHAVITAQPINEAYGIEGAASVWDKLNATQVAGVASNLNFSGASVNTNAYLFRGINASTDISAGTITNLYGINIPALSKSGTAVVTNAYGSYIGMPTAGVSNYCAYFGGTVGIGVTTPAQALDIYSKFQVDNTGNLIRINNVTYTWPAANAAGVLTNSGAGVLTWAAAGGGSGWGLTGNAGTDGGATNFVGTTDNVALSFRVNNQKSGKIDPAGPTYFGYQAGKLNTDVRTTAIGYQALSINTGGSFNTAVGYQTQPTTNGVTPNGSANASFGAWAMHDNTSGGQNTAVGINAMYSNISGMGNTALGYQAMYFCGACGFSNDMVLGSDIGIFMIPTASNQVWIGDNGVTSIKGQVPYAVYSDARIKNNVQENVPGLTFIKELRPVTYNYDYNKEVEIKGGKKTPDWDGKYDIEKIKFSGFIAQEVEASANKIGYDFSGVDRPKSDKDLYSLRYSDFVVPLVKAVQELSTQNDELKIKMEQLAKENKEMKAEMEKIKQLLETNNKK